MKALLLRVGFLSVTFSSHLGTEAKTTSKTRIATLVINGTDAAQGRYPYIGTLDRDPPPELLPSIVELGGYTPGGSPVYNICGSSLIAPDMVLSAAHCAGSQIKRVRVGVYNATPSLTRRNADFELMDIEKIVTHPAFQDRGVLGADVMVIKLYNTTNIQPIRLNRDPSIPAEDGNSALLRIIGFGRRNLTDYMSSLGVLQQAEGTFVNNTQCNLIFSNGIPNQRRVLNDTVCVDFPAGRPCFGDSGSPLMVAGRNSQEDLQVGIVSYGIRCAEQPYPGVFAQVSTYFEWIADHVCRLSTAPPAYFECATRATVPPTPAPNSSSTDPMNPCHSVNVTLRLQADRYPQELGYTVRLFNSTIEANSEVNGQGSRLEPLNRSFTTNELQASVKLDSSSPFTFSITDALSDGIGGGPFDSTDYEYEIFLDKGGGASTRVVVESGVGEWKARMYHWLPLDNTTDCLDANNTVFLQLKVEVLSQDVEVRLERLDSLGDPQVVHSTNNLDWLPRTRPFDEFNRKQRLVVPISGIDPQGLYRLISSGLPIPLLEVPGIFGVASLNLRDGLDKSSRRFRQSTFIPSYPFLTSSGLFNPFAQVVGEDFILLSIDTLGTSSFTISWVLLMDGKVAGYGPPQGFYSNSQGEDIIEEAIRVPTNANGDNVFSLKVRKSSFQVVSVRIDLFDDASNMTLVEEVLGNSRTVLNFTLWPLNVPTGSPTVSPTNAPTLRTALPTARTATSQPSPEPTGTMMMMSSGVANPCIGVVCHFVFLAAAVLMLVW